MVAEQPACDRRKPLTANAWSAFMAFRHIPVSKTTSNCLNRAPPDPRSIDVRGQRFGRLVALGYSHTTKAGTHWEVQCDCGKIKKVSLGSLRSGGAQSCGCLQRERASAWSTKNAGTHRLSHTSLYNVHRGMKERCYNSNSKTYKYYGGRGISICAEWINDFPAFAKWAQENGYKPGLKIDRRNNDGNYEPSNCHWVTHRENCNNQKNSRQIFFQGKSMTASFWAEHTGVRATTISRRINKGWSVEKALMTPPRPGRKDYAARRALTAQRSE